MYNVTVVTQAAGVGLEWCGQDNAGALAAWASRHQGRLGQEAGLDIWMLLSYKIPREPTAQRVYVWRKLKRLQAQLLDGSVWVLPATPRTREELQWLAAEIIELGGEAWLWEARSATQDQDEGLRGRFQCHVDADFSDILAELGRDDFDLGKLAQRYQQSRLRDYFRSELGVQARAALLAARRKLTR